MDVVDVDRRDSYVSSLSQGPGSRPDDQSNTETVLG